MRTLEELVNSGKVNNFTLLRTSSPDCWWPKRTVTHRQLPVSALS